MYSQSPADSHFWNVSGGTWWNRRCTTRTRVWVQSPSVSEPEHTGGMVGPTLLSSFWYWGIFFNIWDSSFMVVWKIYIENWWFFFAKWTAMKGHKTDEQVKKINLPQKIEISVTQRDSYQCIGRFISLMDPGSQSAEEQQHQHSHELLLSPL